MKISHAKNLAALALAAATLLPSTAALAAPNDTATPSYVSPGAGTALLNWLRALL